MYACRDSDHESQTKRQFNGGNTLGLDLFGKPLPKNSQSKKENQGNDAVKEKSETVTIGANQVTKQASPVG